MFSTTKTDGGFLPQYLLYLVFIVNYHCFKSKPSLTSFSLGYCIIFTFNLSLEEPVVLESICKKK